MVIHIENFEEHKGRICKEMKNFLKMTQGKNYSNREDENHR